MLATVFWMSGRNTRMTYWLISFAHFIVAVAIFVIFVATTFMESWPRNGTEEEKLAVILAFFADPRVWLYFAVSFWIGLCNVVRRYHDRGKTGWWYLFALVPIIGPIWQFIELGFLPGEESDNDWGPPPNYASRQAALEAEIAAMGGTAARPTAFQSQPSHNQPNNSLPRQTFGNAGGTPTFGRRIN